jgi:cobalt/nickel transport protein
MKHRLAIRLLFPTLLIALSPILANGHFAMLIPSTDNVSIAGDKDISLMVQFTHPFEGGPLMQMDKPERFGVVMDGEVTDLLPTLKEVKIDGKSTWETAFRFKRPGDYCFFLVPKPYWEPAEDKFIVHVTKVIVDAFAAEEGWDEPIAQTADLPVEIVPLTRPYSLYEGNVFTGRVMRDNKPVPGAEVEVEWWGKGATKAPTDAHVTQVVKADADGVFSFATPKAGWWGFAALMEADEKIEKDGKEKTVELGAVIWVKAYQME